MPSRAEPRAKLPQRALIAFWGDSLTAGAGGDGHGIDWVVAHLLDVDTVNHGVGGQTSREIAARLGAMPAQLVVDGNRIPAVGPVAISDLDIRLLSTAADRETRQQAGVLAGVRGVLTRDPRDAYVFARHRPGVAVSCPPGTPFVPDLGATSDADVHVLWLGRNNFDHADQVLRDVAACVALLRNTRYLVLGVTTAAGETGGSRAHAAIASLNADLASAYGSAFLDVRRHLIDHGLAAARITPTEADLADIAGDTVAGSLRSDPTHLNRDGYAVVGKFVADQISRRNWIAETESRLSTWEDRWAHSTG